MAGARAHLLVGLVLAALVLSGGHVWLRDQLGDLRFRMLTRAATGAVALVEIDSPSIQAVGQWPWPRSTHARLLRSLEGAGSGDVIFDVDFSTPSRPEEDAAFAAALRAAGGSTVLPAFRQRHIAREDGRSIHVNRPIAAFAEYAWLGLVNVLPERDGVIRRYPFGAMIDGEFIPSVGALMAGRHDQTSPSFRIDFGIGADTVPRVSAIDILRSDARALALVQGRRVIIAGTAAELGDQFLTPNGRIMPGSMVQALAAESILQDRALRSTSRYVALGGLAVLMLLAALAWKRFRLRVLASGALLIALGIEGAAILAQGRYAVVADTSLVLAAAVTYALAAAINEIDIRALLQLVADRRFDRIAMALRDGLVCADDRGRITQWNSAAERIFGYKGAEILGQPFDMLVAPAAQGQAARGFSLSSQSREALERGDGLLVELTGARRSGERFDLECSLSGWQTPDGFQYGAVLRDISQRKRQQERMRFLAERDPTSGLPNRHSLLSALEREVRQKELADADATLILLSIDQFRRLTQLHGTSVSDAVATAVARRLEQVAADARVIARLAGDEFALLAGSPADADRLVDGVETTFRKEAVSFGQRARRVSLSIGTARLADAADAELWLGNARFALEAAKATTANGPVAFAADMRSRVERHEGLEGELRLALDRGEFELFYQPQVDLGTGRVVGAEALIRWRHSERGLVSPGEFMPVVNASSLSERVAAWVLEEGCRQAALWQRSGTPIRVGINLSQSQFVAGDLAGDVRSLLARFDLRPDLVELEVTEEIILDRASAAQDVLHALRAQGVKIAFDDFGTGYGSLTYLKAFPLDTIKIDQSFVRNLTPGSDDAAIVRATIGLGHALGLSVIAEGIESDEISEMLAFEGCDEGQGYFFARPLPVAEFEARFLVPPSPEIAGPMPDGTLPDAARAEPVDISRPAAAMRYAS